MWNRNIVYEELRAIYLIVRAIPSRVRNSEVEGLARVAERSV